MGGCRWALNQRCENSHLVQAKYSVANKGGRWVIQVENFQPFYRFVPRYMDDLRIGAKILRDHLGLEMEKEERAARAKANEKANAAAVAEKVKFTLLRLSSH